MDDTNPTTETSDRPTSWTRRTLLRAAAGAGAVSVSAGAASAQESTPDAGEAAETAADEASSATPTETPEDEDETTVLAQLDSDTRVLDYSVTNVEDGTATVRVTLESQRPRGVVLSDIFGGVASEGVTKIQQTRLTVRSGRETVETTATVFEGETVAVGVAVGGGAVTVSTGLPEEDEQLVALPTGVAIGGATAIAGTGAAAWSKVRDEDSAPTNAWDDGDGGLL